MTQSKQHRQDKSGHLGPFVQELLVEVPVTKMKRSEDLKHSRQIGRL